MSTYNWINGNDFSIDCFFLMDRWLISMILGKYDTKPADEITEHDRTLATLLFHNSKLQWFCMKKAPEITNALKRLLEFTDFSLSAKALRQKEISLMEYLETDIIYTEPSMMVNCDYIREWQEERLFELIDLKDKIVLDVGAGTGRLTFAASKLATRVYASEPVDILREYIRDQIKIKAIENIKVLDGFVLNLPFEDNTFDITLSGHVIGDYYDEEIAEITRVTKNGGYIIICNGDDPFRRTKSDLELIIRGFESTSYENSLGGVIYNYRKLIQK